MQDHPLLTNLTLEQEEAIAGGSRWTRFRDKFLRPALKVVVTNVINNFVPAIFRSVSRLLE